MNIPFIRAEDVEPHLNWIRLTEALTEGHHGSKPEISDQFLSRGPDTMLSRAAWIDGQGIAVKSVTVLPDNPARGRPSVHGAMILFDDHTGEVEAVIDSALVTKWKTAGDSVLGAKLLARGDAKRLLIVGAGAVAASLIEAYRAVFPGIEISVWNRTPARAEDLGIPVVPDLPEAIAQADIIATATMARAPVIRGDWLRQGQHLDLIGAFRADMREVDDTALRRSHIFVDSIETTVDHIGELRIPLASGAISRTDILGDLYDMVPGRIGRSAETDITLFKNGGGAHLDLMTGRMILDVWRGL